MGRRAAQRVTLPATIRAPRAEGSKAAIASSAFELVMGCFGIAIAVGLLMLVLLASDSLFTRKGSFGGAGAMVTRPAPR